MKFDTQVFFETLSKKIKFQYYQTRIKGTLHKDQYTFSIISRSIFIRMKNMPDKSCRET